MKIDAINNTVNKNCQLSANKLTHIRFPRIFLAVPNDFFMRTCRMQSNNKLSFRGRLAYEQSRNLLNECILGYEKQKDELTKVFLEPLIESIKSQSVPVPASILLHGSEPSVINRLVEGIGLGLNKTFDCVVRDVSETPKSQFMSVVTEILRNNAKSNKETGQRHIIMLNDVENYLGMTYNQAKRLLDFNYNSVDVDILKSNNNTENINYFKGILDRCSRPADSGGQGTTFLFTSRHPHLLHPDFRKGKVEKIQFSTPSNEESLPLLFDLIEYNKKVLAKRAEGNPEYKQFLEKLETLDLKKLNNKEINIIKKRCSANTREGAFSYDDFNSIALNACMRTILNKEGFSGLKCLEVELYCAEKSITPENVLRNKKISELFFRKPSQYEQLCAKSEVEDLGEKESAILKNLIEQRKFDRYKLEAKAEKRTLTCFERDYLQQLMDEY